MKTAPAIVSRAKGSGNIKTLGGETDYFSQAGEAIFRNYGKLLKKEVFEDDGDFIIKDGVVYVPIEGDVYVPAKEDGSRFEFDSFVEKYRYEVIDDDGQGRKTVTSEANPYRALPGAIKEPTVILDAFGQGQHQFLEEGVAIRERPGSSPSGINKDSSDRTWGLAE